MEKSERINDIFEENVKWKAKIIKIKN